MPADGGVLSLFVSAPAAGLGSVRGRVWPDEAGTEASSLLSPANGPLLLGCEWSAW